MHSSTFRGLLTQGFASKDLGQMYHASVCIWLISFNSTATAEDGPMAHHRSVIDSFIDMVVSCKREKVVRAACLAIKNLVQVEWIFEIFFHRKVDHVSQTSFGYIHSAAIRSFEQAYIHTDSNTWRIDATTLCATSPFLGRRTHCCSKRIHIDARPWIFSQLLRVESDCHTSLM